MATTSTRHLVAPELDAAIDVFPEMDFGKGMAEFRAGFGDRPAIPLPPELEAVAAVGTLEFVGGHGVARPGRTVAQGGARAAPCAGSLAACRHMSDASAVVSGESAGGYSRRSEVRRIASVHRSMRTADSAEAPW